MAIEVDVWVRGTPRAKTRRINGLPRDPADWDEGDVRTLLSEMLLALEHERHPDGERPEVTLRGFSWIVSPYEAGGVFVHLEMQMGTASAGPLAADEQRLTAMVTRVMTPEAPSERVH
jgi:hypothetical protein